jgi:hypothetical protein
MPVGFFNSLLVSSYGFLITETLRFNLAPQTRTSHFRTTRSRARAAG